RSSDSSSGATKPNPRSASNHRTVPWGTAVSSSSGWVGGGEHPVSPARPLDGARPATLSPRDRFVTFSVALPEDHQPEDVPVMRSRNRRTTLLSALGAATLALALPTAALAAPPTAEPVVASSGGAGEAGPGLRATP